MVCKLSERPDIGCKNDHTWIEVRNHCLLLSVTMLRKNSFIPRAVSNLEAVCRMVLRGCQTESNEYRLNIVGAERRALTGSAQVVRHRIEQCTRSSQVSISACWSGVSQERVVRENNWCMQLGAWVWNILVGYPGNVLGGVYSGLALRGHVNKSQAWKTCTGDCWCCRNRWKYTKGNINWKSKKTNLS